MGLLSGEDTIGITEGFLLGGVFIVVIFFRTLHGELSRIVPNHSHAKKTIAIKHLQHTGAH